MKYFGSDDVNVSRGIRVIVHSQFDSVDLPVGIQEDNDMFFVVVSQRPRLQRNSNYIISLGKDSPESNMFLYVHHLIVHYEMQQDVVKTHAKLRKYVR